MNRVRRRDSQEDVSAHNANQIVVALKALDESIRAGLSMKDCYSVGIRVSLGNRGKIGRVRTIIEREPQG